MKDIPLSLVAVQQLVVDVSKIERRHYRPATDRRENVAEHSMAVAMFAWFLHEHVHSTTNLDLMIRYALVHDFVEVYAGDVNTFASKKDRALKEVREQASLKRFDAEFAHFTTLLATMREYQDGTTPEAVFVWTADKIQALILGQMDDWRTYYEQGITKQIFTEKMNELASKAAPELKGLFEELVGWCKESYRYGVPS